MSEPWGISIIIVNFNYECSLPAGIDSALSPRSIDFAALRIVGQPPDRIVARYGDGSDP